MREGLFSRRMWLGVLLSAAVVLLSGTSLAGSYIDRVILLIDGAGADGDYLRSHPGDPALAKVVHQLAAARVLAAQKMDVGAEIAQAHPHVLLVLEAHERAADAAVRRDYNRFLVMSQRAWEEERILRGVLKQLGFPLPERRGSGR